MFRRVHRPATAAIAIVISLAATPSVKADTVTLRRPHIIAHFDRAAGQVAESVVVQPNGSADVGLILSRQVAHVTTTGRISVLATMPLPPGGGITTPGSHSASVTGIQRTPNGTIYFLYSTGSRQLTGLWRLRPGGVPQRIAAFPAASFLNGLTRDDRTGDFYVSDSTLGRVWTVGPDGGQPKVWASGRLLSPVTLFGANGIKVHAHAVWVSNLDQGTIVRIPMTRAGAAGHMQIVASGLTSADDFAFIGHGDQLLAAMNVPSKLALVTPRRGWCVILDASDGLNDTTAVQVHRGTVYVTSGALTTGGDSNLLTAHLGIAQRATNSGIGCRR